MTSDREKDQDSDSRSRRLRELVDETLTLPQPEREAFVRERTAGDPGLESKLLRLLAEARRVSSPLPVPDRIGPYRILEELGRGGMGRVFKAEQREPVRRTVALKLIKLGMDSEEVVLRFAQERQALALMDHEGIARVFDCGTSESGQPYFVMELVKGVPLDLFCEQQRLSLESRLLLMQQVCAAVQHAHQKGVVHRDLKPANVLVSNDGGRLQIKIIDFGLAKAMGQRLIDATLFTEAGRVVGTPEYMAPEQADPNNQDIDTRADIYSLGVMLYKVLVGELPFRGDELRDVGLAEMQRILREVDPPRPSTRLSTTTKSSTAIASACRLSAGALQRALKTDLDWVVLKALEKDRNRRYDTANALASDLQRYLDHEPLEAGPPSAGYRLKKILHRYRGQVLAAAAVFVTAIAGAIIAIGYWLAARDNLQLANERARVNIELATSEAAARAQFADKVRQFEELSGVVRHDRLVEGEQRLYPAWPDRLPAMEAWLDEARHLLARGAEIDTTIAQLRRNARGPTEEELRRDLESHPRYGELLAAKCRLASLRHSQSIRTGEAKLIEPQLPPEVQALDPSVLNILAWDRVAPKGDERTVWGEEVLGLAYARMAVLRANEAEDRSGHLDTLAWALLANGLDEEARRCSAAALAAAPAAARGEFEANCGAIDDAVNRATAILEESAAAAAALDTELRGHRRWRFPSSAGADEFLHDALVDLLSSLHRFEAELVAGVRRRSAWASNIARLTRDHPNARVGWDDVRRQIRASATYAGQDIELRDEDVFGLVPIGVNPVTGCFEFYHLRSACEASRDPATLPIPTIAPDGSVGMDGATGIVFVLIPGGTFTMGAQSGEPAAPNHDEDANGDEEPPHEVTVQPFFLSRFEATRGQWQRMFDIDPSYYEGTPELPVESVSWTECDVSLTNMGLRLPTEAEWEFAARAGIDGRWACGDDPRLLATFGNLADLHAQGYGPFEAWDDRFLIPAPVGSYSAQRFGLHDVHGNVSEWCFDAYTRIYGSGSSNLVDHVVRGGCHTDLAIESRLTFRNSAPADSRGPGLGVRPARALRPSRR
ncbi:MAG: SUMF1/EgtB/PvdO family nonheme iron enzyme [Planctomycetes bacterium]|nr:SUMF1/EgtB/PvdO family nonheme iron enzyme [Planctomycetota bacterium]